MILNKQNFIYLIFIIFSVYCSGIIATDCDVYKGIVENHPLYKEDFDKVNGNCCRLENRLRCDDKNNIIYVRFYIKPCNIEILFEQLANLPKLQEIDITMDKEPIPSTVGKVTQIRKLKIRYPTVYNTYYNIPNEIGNLVNLEELDLSDSNFEGNIPKEFGKLVNLKILDLHTNHLQGYVPYEFKNLKNLEYLNLSGNILKGFVPPIKSLSSCNIQYNEGICYLKSSICRSEFNECTLDEIRTINKNNNNPNPESGEFENEKDIYEQKFLKPFLIVVSIGVVLIVVIVFIIYKKGNRKPKFSKFDKDNHKNNLNSGNVNPTNYNTSYNTTVQTLQPVASGYSYGPTQPLIPPVTSVAPVTPVTPMAPVTPVTPGASVAPTNLVYYPVPSPVPAAAQPSTYIPSSPATPYNVFPVSQPGLTYGNPAQRFSYVPPQREVANPPTGTIPSPSEMDNNLPPPILDEQNHLPDDVLPSYESLSPQ